MAKNDAILLDGIIQEQMSGRGFDKGESFELFAFEQILKSFDLTQQEMEHGWVDGKNDGGIDGFYTFVNGSLVAATENFFWPKKNVNIEIFIINCKSADTFRQDPLNTLFPTIEELFDFGKTAEDFNAEYSKQLLAAREIAVEAFRKTASALPNLSFRFIYASRGDLKDLASNIASRGHQLKRIVSDYFSNAEISLDYLGATELISLYRKARFVLELPYAEQLSVDQGAFVMLVKLSAYARFVSDEHGNLRRYLFDSNVRDFLGATAVNLDIAQSLSDGGAPDFWWLNNGVTILATSAIPLGKTPLGNALQLHDVQIVNGLQTTQTLHNHVSSGGVINDDCVLVKVIVSDDTAVRDQIIRATNNQSSVELASLSATDKIQRDIEAILEQHNWFYERRKNYYKNVGKPKERFIDPLLLAVAMVALTRKAPQLAGRLKSRFMRDPISRDAVFSEQLPILIWPKVAAIMKTVDQALTENRRPKSSNGRRGLASWRGAVALCAVAENFGTFDYSIGDLLGLDESKILPTRIVEIFDLLTATLVQAGGTEKRDRYFLQRGKADTHTMAFGKQYSLDGVACIGRWQFPSTQSPVATRPKPEASHPVLKKIKPRVYRIPSLPTELLPDDIRKSVQDALPAQPWKPGMQQLLATDLNLEVKVVRRAISELIALNLIDNQIDGVVIDKGGIIQAVDISRADPRFKVGDPFPYGEAVELSVVPHSALSVSPIDADS
jgi:hypothetical protein